MKLALNKTKIKTTTIKLITIKKMGNVEDGVMKW
jgi:hypothetical protein